MVNCPRHGLQINDRHACPCHGPTNTLFAWVMVPSLMDWLCTMSRVTASLIEEPAYEMPGAGSLRLIRFLLLITHQLN
jgi:hypothetical protein